MTIDLAKKREICAKHRLDPRTLDKAIREGLEKVRGLARCRARDAMIELGLPLEPNPEHGGER